MVKNQNVPSRSVSLAEDPAYWQALGQFVERFAMIETILFGYLVSIVQIKHVVARSLFPGMRAADLIERIRHVWGADQIWQNNPKTGLPIREKHAAQKIEIDPVLGQLKTINTVRNSLIHYMSFVTSDKGRVSSNIARAFTVEGIKEHRVSPEILRQMLEDLEKIGSHLTSFIVIPESSFTVRARNWPPLNDAWQYKPEQDHPSPNQNQGRSGKKAR